MGRGSFPLSFVPAEFDLAAHARSRCHGQGTRLEVSHQQTRLQKFHSGCGVDVSLNLAGNYYGLSPDLSADMGALFYRQITLNVNIPLEVTGDPDVACPFDFPLDGQACADKSFRLSRSLPLCVGRFMGR
jgi:hypothetical protein